MEAPDLIQRGLAEASFEREKSQGNFDSKGQEIADNARR